MSITLEAKDTITQRLAQLERKLSRQVLKKSAG